MHFLYWQYKRKIKFLYFNPSAVDNHRLWIFRKKSQEARKNGDWKSLRDWSPTITLYRCMTVLVFHSGDAFKEKKTIIEHTTILSHEYLKPLWQFYFLKQMYIFLPRKISGEGIFFSNNKQSWDTQSPI